MATGILVNGTNNSESLLGSANDDTLSGGLGNDTLAGGNGNDRYRINAGFGNVTLIDSNAMYSHTNHGDDNVIQFGAGLSAAQAIFTVKGNDLILTFEGQTGRITMTGVAGTLSRQSVGTYEFADGTTLTSSDVLTRTRLEGTSGNDVLTRNGAAGKMNVAKMFGYAGNDVLDGTYSNTTYYDGGTGNDTMIGGSGDDTYIVDSTSDVIKESAYASFDTVFSSANSYTLSDNLEKMLLKGSAFSGTGNSLNNELVGNNADNVLKGMAGNDLLIGGVGQDTLVGGAGNDTLMGNDGWDVYQFGNDWGQDVISNDGNGDDTLDFSTVTKNLSVNLAGNLATDGLNKVTGVGIAEIVYTGSGNDTIIGSSKAETFYAGKGNNVLKGGDGADAYFVGEGNDTITDQKSTFIPHVTGGGNDNKVFLKGDSQYGIALFKTTTGNLQIKDVNTGNVTTIQNFNNSGVGNIYAGNYTSLTANDVNLVVSQMASFAASNGISLSDINVVQNNAGLMNIVANNFSYH